MFDSVNEKGELILRVKKQKKKNKFWRCDLKNLTIDVGNTNILFCLFENKRIIKHERISLNNLNFDKLNSFKSLYMMSTSNILISSVVPDCNKILINFFNREMISFLFLKDVLGKINIKSNIKNKKEIGDDRLANTIYAKELLKDQLLLLILVQLQL